MQARLLRDHGAVHVDYAIARSAHRLHRARKHVKAGGILEYGVGCRKQSSDIAESSRAKHRIDYRMREHVSVRVSVQSCGMVDANAAEDELAARPERMDVVTDADSHRVA